MVMIESEADTKVENKSKKRQQIYEKLESRFSLEWGVGWRC